MSKQTDLDDFLDSLASIPDGSGGRLPSDTMQFQGIVVAPGDSASLKMTLKKDLNSPTLFMSSTQSDSVVASIQIKQENTVLFSGDTLTLGTLKGGKSTGVTTSKKQKIQLTFTNNSDFETIVGICLTTSVPAPTDTATTKLKDKK